MELTKIQIKMMQGLICPYCNQPTEYVSSTEVYPNDYGMLYLCRPCLAYVGVHKGTDKAKGRVANHALRQLKIQVHCHFDRLWKERRMKRTEAYRWLSGALELPREYTHIGMFGEATCHKVIELTKSKYQSL
jgi:hypothetical protein